MVKDLTIVQWVPHIVLEGPSWMLIINAAFMQESKCQVLTLKSCQDNGNFKLAHALVLKLVIISGLPDIY